MESDDRAHILENEVDDARSDRSSELRVDLQNAEVMSPTPLGVGSLSSSSSSTSRIDQVIALIRGLPKEDIKMLGAAILEGAEVGEEAGGDSQRASEEFMTPKKGKEISEDSFQKVEFETPRDTEIPGKSSKSGKGRGEEIPPKDEKKKKQGEEIPSKDEKKGEEIPPKQEERDDAIPSEGQGRGEELPPGDQMRGTQTPTRSQNGRSERGSPSQAEEALKMTQEVMRNQNQVNERLVLAMERLAQKTQDQSQSSYQHYQQPQTENKIDKLLKSDVKIQKIHFGEVGTRAVELEKLVEGFEIEGKTDFRLCSSSVGCHGTTS